MQDTPENRARAFICYSRTDSEFARKLADDLRARGLGIWLDQLDIHGGANWDDEVDTALDVTRTLLVLLSAASTSSEHVKDELAAALEGGSTVIPLVLEDCKVPHRILRKQRFFFRAEDNYESSLDLLCADLRSGLPAPPRDNASGSPRAEAGTPSEESPTPSSAAPGLRDPRPPGLPAAASAPPSPPKGFPAKLRLAAVLGLLGLAGVVAFLITQRGSEPKLSASEAALARVVASFVEGAVPAEADLRALDCPDLRKARNVPFARHGRPFKAPDLTAFFEGFPWYVAEEGKEVPCDNLGRFEQSAFHLIEVEQCSRCREYLVLDRCDKLNEADLCSS